MFRICLYQGNLVLPDFDIRMVAGGSFKAVPRDFLAQVSENYLEIHLFWSGKGTCCIPSQGTYGPSISAISARRNVDNNNQALVPYATTGTIMQKL